jgi:hypothetical protein
MIMGSLFVDVSTDDVSNDDENCGPMTNNEPSQQPHV